jgi:hypothetical protein
LEHTVLDILRASPRRARFVPEIQAVLRRSGLSDPAALESALLELEAAGQVIVRDHYCADPHTAGTDLRVVALVPEDGPDDPQASAIAAIERTWDHWLSQYFANHRCG